jgi:phytoene dehydrogenase-like protein
MAEKVMPGLRDHIVYQEGMTPKTIHHYTLNYQGSPYGMQFNVANRNRMDLKTPIAGLYGAGAWYFPAHGVGMTQVSGYMAARSILNEENKN